MIHNFRQTCNLHILFPFRNVQRGAGGGGNQGGGGSAFCQNCLQPGHWTHQCKNEKVYVSRPTRTQQMKDPKVWHCVNSFFSISATPGSEHV